MPDRIIDHLATATACVAQEYMYLPMAGRNPHSLERVYSYELYHQLRLATGHIAEYSWGGEVDKGSHPHFINPVIARRKPDLLFHRPGDHEGNLLVVEIKMLRNIDLDAVTKDLETLTAFRTTQGIFRGYEHAVYLLVGDNDEEFSRIKRHAMELYFSGQIDLNLISLFYHKYPEVTANEEMWD